MSFSENIGENFDGTQESEASVQERLRNMRSQAAQNKGVKKQMKKDENKARRSEQELIEFLIKCIHADSVETLIVEALSKALQDNHSAFLLVEILTLIYIVDGYHADDHHVVDNTALSLHTNPQAADMNAWLKRLQEAGFEVPQKTLKSIDMHPRSLAYFIEVVLQVYKNHYPNSPCPVDLVQASEALVVRLQKAIRGYILEHSIEGER